MTDESRMVGGARRHSEREDAALRPKLLKDIVGQDRVRENLKIMIDAARARAEPLDHVLFYGPPGLGKTSLAHVVANEMDANIRITAGPSIERAGDLAAILTHLKQGDILFIDEVHRLGRAVEEILYPCHGRFRARYCHRQRPCRQKRPPELATLHRSSARTTRLSLLAGPLRDRFGARFLLDFYDQQALEFIINRAAGMLKVEIKQEGAQEIARRGRGTPRIALRLLRRVRDYAQTRANGVITGPVAGQALELMEVDFLGLDEVDRRLLFTIIEKFEGGPVGLNTLSAAISEDSATIQDVYEPYLIRQGFIRRTNRGRIATRLAYEHLGILYERKIDPLEDVEDEEDAPDQPPLL